MAGDSLGGLSMAMNFGGPDATSVVDIKISLVDPRGSSMGLLPDT